MLTQISANDLAGFVVFGMRVEPVRQSSSRPARYRRGAAVIRPGAAARRPPDRFGACGGRGGFGGTACPRAIIASISSSSASCGLRRCSSRMRSLACAKRPWSASARAKTNFAVVFSGARLTASVASLTAGHCGLSGVNCVR